MKQPIKPNGTAFVLQMLILVSAVSVLTMVFNMGISFGINNELDPLHEEIKELKAEIAFIRVRSTNNKQSIKVLEDVRRSVQRRGMQGEDATDNRAGDDPDGCRDGVRDACDKDSAGGKP